MIKKQEERELKSNKHTAFRHRGRPVDPKKLERYKKHRQKELAEDQDADIDRDEIAGGQYPLHTIKRHF